MARAKKSKVKVSELEGQPDPRAPLDSAGLLAACQGVLARLEADLLERAKSSPAVTRALEARYQAEKAAERTAESFAGWTALLATQVAAAWVLSCVFVRTLEDRGLLKQVRLAGPGAEDSQRQFFQLAPSLTERDYLLTVFRELAHHPAARDLFDAEHSPVWKLSPSAAAAKELLALFRLPNATTPAFRFGQASTRFLGDLYQDLSEDVRKRYALLQTPDFIESFILDRTLEPAIQRFGLDDTTLIDPTCGSGHFLLGAFDRLFEHRLRAEPGIDPRVAAVKALDCVYGADINPYAVAIARFRLTLSFLEKAGYARLADAPALPLHLVVADSLRINAQHPQAELWQQEGVSSEHWLGEVFALEDEKAAKEVLFRQYTAVVGNPPYITPTDTAMSTAYARMYTSAFRKYSLSVPFCERLFQLTRPRGHVGQITANSFMKREFGKRLVEEYLQTVNLEKIVNSSGAYIPGHGTPTVILFGTHEPPQRSVVLAILAKRGEPSTPNDPSQGKVWQSIVGHDADLGFENDYISVAHIDREVLGKHPWSLGGGGASELKLLLEERAAARLSDLVESVGVDTITRAADLLEMEAATYERLRVEAGVLMPCVIGEDIRDWCLASGICVPVPYSRSDWNLQPIDEWPGLGRFLWPHRTWLAERFVSGGTRMSDVGLPYWAIPQLPIQKHRAPLSIAFAFVATHNHFSLDRGGKVFKQSAPIIKLPEQSTEHDHFSLLAYLNSSVAAFYFRQAGHSKGAQGVNEGHKSEQWEQFLEYSGALIESLPIPPRLSELAEFGERADAIAREILELRPAAIMQRCRDAAEFDYAIAEAEKSTRELLHSLCAIQEAIDWRTYRLFGLTPKEPLGVDSIEPGLRPFEYKLLQMTPETAWFDRNKYVVPAGIPPAYGAMELIYGVREIALLEQPEFKRRWTLFDYKGIAAEAMKHRFLTELETKFRDSEMALSLKMLSDNSSDSTSRAASVDMCSVPFLGVMRFTLTGLAKHKEWLMYWDIQRRQDAGGPPVDSTPPRYQSTDYVTASCWQLRGRLDVPKERFISYPGCESDNDGEPVYGWAGWDHLQRAKALASLYLNRKDVEGWTADRLTPMLAGLLELIPWVKQWHNEPSEEFGGLRMGDYYEQFLDGECRLHGLTHDDLRAWRPAKKTRGSGKATTKAKAAKANGDATESGNGHASAEAPAAKKPRKKKQAAAAKEPPSSEEAE